MPKPVVLKVFSWRITYTKVMGMRRLHWWRHIDGEADG